VQTVDELLDRFEQAWQNGSCPRIESFLSACQGADSVRRELLIELIKIDLQRRWSRPGGDRPLLNAYVEQFRQLGPVDGLPAELVGEEYRVRRCWGDRPSHHEFLTRFAPRRAELQEVLRRIDAQLAVELPPAARSQATARPADSQPPAPEPQPLASAAQLQDVLRQQKLLTTAQLAELSKAGRDTNPRALAKRLLERNWLTPYQVNQLLQGRGHELAMGPYVLLERLGEGGAGQVFKARHQKLERVAALKVIRKELLADAEILSRFYREIQVLSQLDHPNVVHAYDAGPAGATHFLAMEYVEGTDLGRLVKQGGRLPVEQACAYIRQAALGLQHAHERGLVHRDIKPHNLIMSVHDGLIKVADLGLARLPRAVTEDAALTAGTLTPHNSVLMGTADYLAPEQALDFHAADIRADIYSLGCTFYYLLTGQPPFVGGNLAQKLAKHLHAEPPAIEQLRPDLPALLPPLVRKMLAKRPEDRYQTPADVATALAPLAQSAQRGRSSFSAQEAMGKNTESAKGGKRAASPLCRLAILVGAGLLGLALVVVGRSFWPTAGPSNTSTTQQVREEPLRPAVDKFAVRKQGGLHVTAFSADGKRTASGSSDALIVLWDTASGVEQFTLAGHKQPISHLAFSPDGRLLASGSVAEQTWKLWDLNARRELASFKVEAGFNPGEAMVGPFSADGKYLAVRQGKGIVSLVNVADQTNAVTFPPLDGANALSFSADARLYAVADGSLGHMHVYEIATRKELARASDGSYVRSLSLSPDGALLAAARWSNEVHLLDVAASLKPRAVCKGHSAGVLALAFAPDGKTLASAGADQLVKLWDVATGKERDTLKE
jgi:serine/threonine protein kinase/WD40 repeat protein